MTAYVLRIFAAALLCLGAIPVSAAEENAQASTSTRNGASALLKDVTPDEAAELIKKDDVVVLDVRTPDEFQAGHIAGATNVDALEADFSERVAKLPKDKSYVLHCASGGRSTRVLDKMKALKFQSIYHLNGGMKAWKDAGKPVVQ